jgi:hypothetical protein
VAVFFNVKSDIEVASFAVDVTLVKETMDALTVRTCTR